MKDFEPRLCVGTPGEIWFLGTTMSTLCIGIVAKSMELTMHILTVPISDRVLEGEVCQGEVPDKEGMVKDDLDSCREAGAGFVDTACRTAIFPSGPAVFKVECAY